MIWIRVVRGCSMKVIKVPLVNNSNNISKTSTGLTNKNTLSYLSEP
jgi:hypothetical protein